MKESNIVSLAIIALLLLVHMTCDAHTLEGECESCLNGEPTTIHCVLRDLSMGSLSAATADLGLFDLADVLYQIEEVIR